jgi:tripartite-type tricarboxylate transporter receptor subunit TctC
VPGYESVSALGVFAPAGTSPAIINRLNQEIVRILNRTDVKSKFLSVGTEVVGSSTEEFAVKITSDIARLGKVIKRTGIKAD